MLWSLFSLRKQFSTNSSEPITTAMLIKVHPTICIISQFSNLVKLHHVEGGRRGGHNTWESQGANDWWTSSTRGPRTIVICILRRVASFRL
jgi:hypothetical protein